MKRRYIAFFCCILMLLSLLPPMTWVKASTEQEMICIDSPEQAVQTIMQDGNCAKTKGLLTEAQQNERIRRRVIFKSSSPTADNYGAVKTYYYSVGGYQILCYDSADEAEYACSRLRKDYPDVLVFQDIPISLDDAAQDSSVSAKHIQDAGAKITQDDNGSKLAEDEEDGEEVTAYDGIHMMGMDQLKEEAGDWNASATVAVIDSGIDTDHPWFDTRLDRTNSINFAADIADQTAYNDETQGHGTHVAGIVTQATPEQVKVMAIRVFDLTGSASYATITMAVDYAVEHKAEVINMSLGFEIASGYESVDTELMDEAFARALQAGSTVCVASGNEFTDTSKSYPASSRWTIAVGSVEKSSSDDSYIRSDFSNNGELLDFVAPGRNIYSAWIGEGEQTMIASGTSMATPHLAAAAAYVKMKHPTYNQRDVYAELRDYAVDLGTPGKDTEFGYGYVDLENYADESASSVKHYQGITAPAQINKTMNDCETPFTLEATVTHGDGTLNYSTTNEKVATVNGNQVMVTGVGSCDIIITAQETAEYAKTEQKVRIRVTKGEQSILVPQYTYKKHISDKNFWVTASVEQPGDGKLVFLANDNPVLQVREDGYVTITGVGTTQIYAVAKATDNFVRQVSDAITVTVEEDPAPNATKKPMQTQKPIATKKPLQTQTPSATPKSAVAQKSALQKVVVKKAQAGHRSIRLSWQKKKGISMYQVRYSTKRNMKKSVLLKTNRCKKTLSHMKAKKAYYIQVRTIVKKGRKTQYGAWSKRYRVVTKA